MSLTRSGETLSPMSDNDKDKAVLGRQLEKEVAQRDGLSVARLCRIASVSNPTYYQAVRGKASAASYERFAAALAEWDEYPADRKLDEPPNVSEVEGIIEVELEGVFGVDRVFVRGPVSDTKALSASVEAVLARLRASMPPK